MAYCINCGKPTDDDENFCGYCGTKIIHGNLNDKVTQIQHIEYGNKQQNTVTEKKQIDCPNCNAPLPSFVSKCPYCGYEIRGMTGTSSVREFGFKYANASSNSQKIDLVRTFAIPNTREDILEFAILASSNINPEAYLNTVIVVGGVSQQNLSDAWMAKFEQTYQKANLMLNGDDLERINKLYFDKKRALENARTRSAGKRVLDSVFGNDFLKVMTPFILIMLMLLALLTIPEKKLERQAREVEQYIANGDYDMALTTAYAMSDDYSSSWTETRANLINRILELKGAYVDRDGLIKIPIQKMKGKQVEDVVSTFKKAGFTNIITEPVSYEPIIGLLDKSMAKQGEVEEVSINGETDYSRGSLIEADSKIIIRYHKK